MRSATVPMDMNQIRHACPAVFQDNPHPDRSEKYVHISTQPVLQAMLDAGYGVSKAQQTKSRTGAAQGYARHLLAFRPLSGFAEAKIGGAVPEVVLLNSHDGNCSYRLHIGIYRFVCENGMIAGQDFETIKIRHRGNPAHMVVEESHKILENYVPRLTQWVEEAQQTQLTTRSQNKFAREAQIIRFPEPGFDPKELLHARRASDEGNDVWSVYNRVQENLMRGGIKFTNANGRACETKPINRVTKDVIFNQKLWDVASTFLKEAA